MTLEEFLAIDSRLPTADEFIGLCDSLDVKFCFGADGRPVLRGTPDTRDVRELLSQVLKREPWRSQVIEKRLSQPAQWPCEACGADSPARIRGADGKLRCGPCADKAEPRT